MDGLEERLGYKFRNRALLRQAMTHPSLSAELKSAGSDNQRLEFLGDAVLQLTLTEILYERLSEEPEGRLTQLRASVVSKPALASCARRLELGPVLRLGKGEAANDGRDRDSNLADAFEALLGAIHLDGGMKASRDVIGRVMEPTLAAALRGESESNPKGKLQEVLQALHSDIPVYNIVSEEGPDHLKQFVAEVVWRGAPLALGRGSSKKAAEIDAARSALQQASWEG